MRLRNVISLLAAALLLGSCAAPKISYFQDLKPGTAEEIMNTIEIKVQPEDKIMILVSSKEPQLMSLFNLSISSRNLGTNSGGGTAAMGGGTSGNNNGVVAYTVRKDGSIDFPVLGDLYIAGMTREQIAAYIKNELISQNLVKDPVVTVEFVNLTVTLLGEVTKPGRYNIDKDRLTLLDAISMAGDLTIFGKRDNVLVQRDEKGKKMLYQVNLNSGPELYASPVYYLQQNDVVYVEPNGMKARQSTVNGNSARTPGFWTTLLSLVFTLTSTTILILNK